MKKLLFVCTGNTCRSAMAAAMAAERIREVGLDDRIAVSSAGLHAREGQPASRHAVDVLRERGIDLRGHGSRRLTAELAGDADLAVVMTGGHRDELQMIAPGMESKVILFGELDTDRKDPDIEDPIGGDRSRYERTREELDKLVTKLIDYLVEKYELKENHG